MTIEEHRHQCEVRHVLKLRGAGKHDASRYLDLVEKARGMEARYRLEDDAKKQWARGNRGSIGDWRT